MRSFATLDDQKILKISRSLMLLNHTAQPPSPKNDPGPRSNCTSMGAIRQLTVRALEEIKEVWLAKHVLTQKVQRIRGTAREDGWFTPDDGSTSFRLGKDCFLTREEAHEHANTRRRKKIDALSRQIQRIEALTRVKK